MKKPRCSSALLLQLLYLVAKAVPRFAFYEKVPLWRIS